MGMLFQLSSQKHWRTASIVLYICMCWAVVVAIKPLIANVAAGGIAFLVAGGIAYTSGVYFYKQKHRKYHHAVWHLFVLAGSILHFLAILKYVKFPLAAKENLRNALRYEMEKYFPFSEDEIYFDFQIISEDKGTGKMQVFLVAAKRESVDPYLDFCNRLDLGLSSIEITSTAIANYFSRPSRTSEEDALAIVYFKDNNLELDFLRGKILNYSRFIKENEKNLAEVVLRELKTLREGLGDDLARLNTVFCGLDSKDELINHCKADERLSVCFEDLSGAGVPSYGIIPAYGLALKGLQKVPNNINLVPDKFRKRPSRIGYNIMILLISWVILSGIALGGGTILFQQLHLSRLSAEIVGLRAEFPRIERIKAECKKAETQIDYLNSLRSGDMTALNVLKELSQEVPKNAWVKTFTYSDKEVKIQGFAGSASELIPFLESSPLFENVTFLSPITRTKAGKELFRIGLKINKDGNVDVRNR